MMKGITNGRRQDYMNQSAYPIKNQKKICGNINSGGSKIMYTRDHTGQGVVADII